MTTRLHMGGLRALRVGLAAAVAGVLALGVPAAHTGAQVPGDVTHCYGPAGYLTTSPGQWQMSTTQCVGVNTAAATTTPPVGSTNPFDYTGYAFNVAGPVVFQGINLSATGTFACGNGSLSGTGWYYTGNDFYSFSWNATFSDGEGNFTAPALSSDGVTVRTLSVHMLVVDGAPAACNDNQTPRPAAGNPFAETVETLD